MRDREQKVVAFGKRIF